MSPLSPLSSWTLLGGRYLDSSTELDLASHSNQMTCADSQRLSSNQKATGYIPQASTRQGSFHGKTSGSIAPKYTDTKLSYSTTSFSGVTFAKSDKAV